MNDLDTLRHHIDDIDESILDLLEIRMKVTDEIGKYKKANNVPVTQKDREKSLKEKLTNESSHPVLKEKIGNIFQQIIEASKISMKLKNAPECPFKNIGIIGLGLMGGSIAKSLKAKNKDITISTLKRESKDIKSAYDSKIIDAVYDSIGELIQHNELVIIASPIDTVRDICKKISSSEVKKKLIVIDIASVKGEIANLFKQETTNMIEFLPTHPMAGSEHIGFADSATGLFVNKPWVICPHTKTQPETKQQILQLIESLGSNPIFMDPKTHDDAVAKVSHLIFLVSTYLFAYCNNDKQAMETAGTGFESTTRLASGNALMHAQIFEKNSENIAAQLAKFIDYIQQNKVTVQTAQNFFEKNKKQRDEFINR